MKWADGIKGYKFVNDLGESPAAVHRETGIIYINARIWPKLNKEARFFVLLHEYAHIKLKSTDEKAVDKLAFEEYAKRGYSLKQSIYALTRLLTFTNLEQYERANLQMARAAKYDLNHYGNTKWQK